MTLEIKDINLNNFLQNFTFQSDASPGNKIVLDNAQFVICAALLKLDSTLVTMRSKLNG